MANSQKIDPVKMAKERMKNGFWSDYVKERNQTLREAEETGKNVSDVSTSLIRRAREVITLSPETLKKQEEEYLLVVKILESPEPVNNPLMILAKDEYYATADEEERLRIIMDASKRFKKHKTRYLNEQKG